MTLETQIDAAEAWKIIRQNGSAIKGSINGMLTTIAAGGVSLEYILFEVYVRILNSKSQLELLAAVDGLDVYVATLKPLYVATTAIADVTAAQQAVLTWINTNAEGLSLTGDTAANALASGSVVSQRWSAAQLSGLITLLNAVKVEISG